ncbi:GvpL/GvpF family gas vesicle protein [Streptomyces zingiberis]|uniref:GvpL/GvpF family gas vesicle protein n=1 Tax=Streptomyces zingiberis TaxID=2053010 RepID=A0ABX1BUD3_9ACTN|nr:GvpL/GvpF family gas vesicle protein [Streptomyces zingiberis]NJQ01334.1 GvpL/GvpF family gas vesicle protein [Streptomyces zingiberis]
MTTLRYVYAVVRPGGPPLPGELRGVSGAPVGTVDGGGVTAVVSPVPAEEWDEEPLRANLENLDWLERAARGHQQVVDAVAALGVALPLRLATLCRDEEGVRRMLDGDAQRFERAFGILEGRDEWGVKIFTEPDPAGGSGGGGAEAGGTGTGGPAPSRPASGRDYLRQRQAHRRSREDSSRRADTWARRVHDELVTLAEHTRLHQPQNARLSGAAGENVLNAAYLVPRDQAGPFAARVGELARDTAGLRVELTGPWAPYSFTAFATGAEEGGGTGSGSAGAAPAAGASAGERA